MVGLAGHAARPGSAEACSVAPDSITIRDTPANGVVVVDVGCSFGNCFEGELPDELPVMDKTTGEMVNGSIVLTNGSIDGVARITWKPESPLVEGHTYELLWQPAASQAFAEVDYEFSALAAASWTADDIVVTASTWLSEGASKWVTCETANTFDCGPNEAETYTVHNPLDAAQLVGLQAAIDAVASPAGSEGQYVVTAALWAEGEEQPEQVDVPGELYSSISVSEAFDTAFNAYCYRVEVTSLIDDTLAVTEDCLPHTFGELTVTPLSDAQIATQLGWCAAPPDDEGYDDLWCTGRRARCAEAMMAGWEEPGCKTIEEQCSDVLDPMDPFDPNDPNDPNDPKGPNDPMDPSDPHGGDDHGDGDGEEDNEVMGAQPGLEGGCSTTSDHRGRAWPGLLFATIFLAVRVRRARKSA
jgi:hypothetical protein